MRKVGQGTEGGTGCGKGDRKSVRMAQLMYKCRTCTTV